MEIINENNFEDVSEITNLPIDNLVKDENDGIENSLIKLTDFKFFNFKFILFILITPLCISIVLLIIVFIIFHGNREINEIEMFYDSYFALESKVLKCHEKASSYYNSYLRRYMCVCDKRYTGNGVTHCDSCGIPRRTNVLRIVGGFEAVRNSWPMAVYLEQNYKNTYYFNNSNHVVTKVRLFKHKD
jgi:hypothetical protein